MRGIAYVAAALAAIGIMVVIAKTDVDSATPANAVSVASPTLDEAGSMTLAVPEMHCSFSCFPRVKETLEQNEAVQQVELGPQKDPNAIDNRQVIVQYKAGFNLEDALKNLSKEGFTDSEMVQ